MDREDLILALVSFRDPKLAEEIRALMNSIFPKPEVDPNPTEAKKEGDNG